MPAHKDAEHNRYDSRCTHWSCNKIKLSTALYKCISNHFGFEQVTFFFPGAEKFEKSYFVVKILSALTRKQKIFKMAWTVSPAVRMKMFCT